DALAGGGADCDALVLTAHEGKLAYAGDVDEPFRAREPHGHERHEALPAGDDSRVVAGGQHCASLVDIRRPCIIERGGFHRRSGPGVEAVAIVSIARPFGAPEPSAPPCIRQALAGLVNVELDRWK